MPRLLETSVELEVPFHDVDMMGVVWHGHYLKYVEAARTALLSSCGLDAGDLIGPRYLLYIIESRCRYAYPLRYRDHAWFAAFAPVEAPEIVIAVLVEHGGGGGAAAAPIAQRVLQRFAETRGYAPEARKQRQASVVSAGAAEPDGGDRAVD